MGTFLPKTTSSQHIQKSYRSLFNEVISTKEPLVVLTNNTPEVVIVDIQTFEELLESKTQYELLLAKHAIAVAKKEKGEKKIQKLSSLRAITNGHR